jgi:hypothetical protein
MKLNMQEQATLLRAPRNVTALVRQPRLWTAWFKLRRNELFDKDGCISRC